MNNLENSSKIPADATHVWTPAISLAIVGFYFRRSYYKKVKGVWYSYNINQEWVVSGNTADWFKTEKQLGYFVTVRKFTKPGFVPVKEYRNV